jgi:3-oxo-5-alpha-steroid 4-dehydrogenase 1
VDEAQFFPWLLRASFGVALMTATYLLFMAAPYGRHARAGFGPLVNNSLGWVIMEAPAALLPLVYFAMGEHRDVATLCMLVIWETHYFQRAFLYPWLIRGRGAPMPLFVCLSGAFFNVLNSYLNFRYLCTLGPGYAASWLLDPRFLAGIAIFAAGYAINRWADRALRTLRKPGETGYKIPRGGLYELISCPNYFGELLSWCGFALLAWNGPALFFALFTAANLVPRAISHHRDYGRRFPEYPAQRRAILPYLL